jgi:alkaline phosphatase D
MSPAANFLLTSLFFLAIKPFECSINTILPDSPVAIVQTSELTITFGSCNHQDYSQDYWTDIASEDPDIWLWLGDNIYGDTENMEIMKAKYDQQSAVPAYKDFVAKTLINGVWDDHDYGVNDGGKDYPMKAESQQVFLDFIKVVDDSPRRTRPGIYDSQIINEGDLSVTIFYLDTRYFRDPIIGTKGKWAGESTGTILGDDQWDWLDNAMCNSQSDVNIIASGIQVIAEDHGWEKWGNFPAERKRLLDMIVSSNLNMPIILSGDRHTSEISQIDWEGVVIYDVTSSSLNKPINSPREEVNTHRLPSTSLVFDAAYGLMEISKVDSVVTVDIGIKTAADQTAAHCTIN